MSIGLYSVALAASPPKYMLVDLGTLGGASSTATAINARGQVTGSSTLAGDQVTHAFVYRQDEMHDLGTPAGTQSAVGTGINASGQVSGNATTSSGKSVAWLYRNGAFTNLAPSDTGDDFAQAVNEAGDVAGYAEGSSIFYDGTLHALPFGFYSSASGINNADQVTGSGITGGPMNVEAAYIYDVKTATTVQFGGLNGALYLGASAINDNGTVAGTSDAGFDDSTADDLPEEHAYLYDAGGIHDLGTLGGTNSEGLAINSRAEVVGSSQIKGDVSTHAFLYSNGAMVDLNTLLASGPLSKFVTLNSATGINDQGWIVANGTDSRTGQHHAYLLESSACDVGAEDLFHQIVQQLEAQREDLEHLKRIVREARADYDAGDLRDTRFLLENLIDDLRRHQDRGIPHAVASQLVGEATTILEQLHSQDHDRGMRSDRCYCGDGGGHEHSWPDRAG